MTPEPHVVHRDPPPPVVVKRDGWTVVARGGHPPEPTAHLLVGPPDKWSAVRTRCGLTVRRIAWVDPGTVARLCPACEAAR